MATHDMSMSSAFVDLAVTRPSSCCSSLDLPVHPATLEEELLLMDDTLVSKPVAVTCAAPVPAASASPSPPSPPEELATNNILPINPHPSPTFSTSNTELADLSRMSTDPPEAFLLALFTALVKGNQRVNAEFRKLWSDIRAVEHLALGRDEELALGVQEFADLLLEEVRGKHPSYEEMRAEIDASVRAHYEAHHECIG